MKQSQLVAGAVLLDPAGEEHEIVGIDTTTGADHSGWKYFLKVGKRKLKPLPLTAIQEFFTLKEEHGQRQK